MLSFDALEFSCAAAFIADFPFFHSGYLTPPGTLGGEYYKPGRGKGVAFKLELERKEVSFSCQ